jgi:hypothetical protein
VPPLLPALPVALLLPLVLLLLLLLLLLGPACHHCCQLCLPLCCFILLLLMLPVGQLGAQLTNVQARRTVNDLGKETDPVLAAACEYQSTCIFKLH